MNNPTTPSATLDQEPFYLPVGDEVALFKAAYAQRLPVLLKGPTGCGKTRFVEYMAYQLFLAYAYEQGDLSRVYPIARGAAPMLVLAPMRASPR